MKFFVFKEIIKKEKTCFNLNFKSCTEKKLFAYYYKIIKLFKPYIPFKRRRKMFTDFKEIFLLNLLKICFSIKEY